MRFDESLVMAKAVPLEWLLSYLEGDELLMAFKELIDDATHMADRPHLFPLGLRVDRQHLESPRNVTAHRPCPAPRTGWQRQG
jgi:hypothetical protein